LALRKGTHEKANAPSPEVESSMSPPSRDEFGGTSVGATLAESAARPRNRGGSLQPTLYRRGGFHHVGGVTNTLIAAAVNPGPGDEGRGPKRLPPGSQRNTQDRDTIADFDRGKTGRTAFRNRIADRPRRKLLPWDGTSWRFLRSALDVSRGSG